MVRLAEFKLLARVSLPNIGDIACSGLTLIVGPNSSGKSQFLLDIYHRLCGTPRKLVVAQDVRVNKPPNFKWFIESLEAEGYIHSSEEPQNINPRTMYSGTGQPIQPMSLQQADTAFGSFDPNKLSNLRQPETFLSYFGKMLVTALFLERRLNALISTNPIPFETQAPQHDFHVLHFDDAARQKLTREIDASFGKSVWTDISHGAMLCLRVNDGKLPSPDDRLSVREMSKYRTIETEGDGLKSYVSICIALLLGRRSVCLIDEPEMCLHPPQAYNLGRFIGAHGSSGETATFVATHSSQILRGVVQSNKQAEIIRLTRRNGGFIAHRLSADDLAAALEKPTLRAESALDGIFSESVIVLEADSDRLVYQTALETLSEELRLDVHFAAVGGTGGIADICKLYRRLNIPVAVIADLDLVVDLDKMRLILRSLMDERQAEVFVKKARIVADEIKKSPPTVSPGDFRARLHKIATLTTDWENNDDVEISKELRGLSNDLNRMRQLKSGGISALPPSIATKMRDLAESLKAVGLFLVPVGELEGWLAAEGIEESKEKKAAWANAAALKIQANGPRPGDVWDFMRGVGNYLTNGIGNETGS